MWGIIHLEYLKNAKLKISPYQRPVIYHLALAGNVRRQDLLFSMVASLKCTSLLDTLVPVARNLFLLK